MYMKKLRTWIKKKKILDPYPPSCSPSWHLCYDSEALTEERGVGSKDITQWYDHLPWPPPTNVPLWVRPPCSHMTMMIITSVQKKLQVLHALQMMGFHSLSKPTIASVMKLTQYKRIGHIPFIITTCIWKFIDWEIVPFFFSNFGCLGFNACKYCFEIWPVPLHTDSRGSWFCVEEMKQGDVSVSHTTEGILNHMLIIKPWQMAFWCIKNFNKKSFITDN